MERSLVVSDCLTALYGACQGRAGVMAIAGTGSVIVAREHAGDFHRVGGWGHRFGDQGSAYWIGVQALTRAARAHDLSKNNNNLVDVLCQWLGATCLPDALPVLYGEAMDKTRLAALAEYLFREAAGLDAVQTLFREAGVALAEQVRLVMRLGDFEADLPLFLSGSVLAKNPYVSAAMWESLQETPLFKSESMDPPHVGAARWARECFAGGTA